MSIIITKKVSSDDLDTLINNTFGNKEKTIAILERWFCKDGDAPDFFDRLNNVTNISEWDRGRVFNDNCEIRWEREGDSFHVVWIDDSNSISGNGWEKEEIHYRRERKVLLWGERIHGQARWYEKQVPRIFEYPVDGNGERAYVVLNEYTLNDGSTVYRFKEVKAE